MRLIRSISYPFKLLLTHATFTLKSPSISFPFFVRRSFALVAQLGVQWRDLGSPQPPPPRFKQSAYLSSRKVLGLQARATAWPAFKFLIHIFNFNF